MTSDVGLNISQLRILLRILRNKLGTQMFEPENIMKSLSGDMILPKFGEYKYMNMNMKVVYYFTVYAELCYVNAKLLPYVKRLYSVAP